MEQLERSFREILNGSMEAVYITDLEYHLLYINRAACEIGDGMEPEEAEGKMCYEVLLGRSTPCPFCRLGELSDQKYTTRCFRGVAGRVMELRGKRISWIGQPAHIEYIRDITEKELAQKQSRQLKAQQQNLYEHIGIGMCLYQYQGGRMRALMCNHAYRQLFQLPDTFDAGDSISLEMENFIGKNTAELKNKIIEHIHAQKPLQQICQIRDQQTGLPRNVLVNLECAPQEDESVLWYISAYDVTAWVESENRLNSVLNSIDGGIAIFQVNRQGHLCMLYCTDGLASMHGYTREEYDREIENDVFKMTCPEDRQKLMDEIDAALDKMEPLSTVYRARKKENSYVWVNLFATPIGMDSEGCMRYTAVFTNASSQFSLYQEMLNLSENGLLVTDRDTREIYFANDTAKKMLTSIRAGRERNLGKQRGEISPILIPDPLVARKERIAGQTYQIYPHDIEWMGRPSIAQYFSNISEEIQLQKKLTAEEERYRMVVEESNIALMDYDVIRKRIYVNDPFRQYAVCACTTADYFNFSNGFELVHPEDHDQLQRFYDRLRATGKAVVEEIRLQMQDGSYRWSELHGIEVTNERGKPVRKLCFIRDIDEVMQQYQQLKTRYDYELARINNFENGVVERMNIDLTDDRVIWARGAFNRSIERLVGKNVGELLRMRLSACCEEKERQDLNRFMNRDALLRAYETMDFPALEMSAVMAGQREKRYYRTTAQIVKNPGNGHIIAFVETRDIDKSKTEDILMRRLLETNYESALLIHAVTGRIKIGITKGNESFITGVQQTYDELVRQDIRQTVPLQEQEQVLAEMALDAIREKLQHAPLCSGRTARIEQGRIAYKMWTAAYFDEDGQYILLTTSNITEVYQKDLENAAVLEEALQSAEVASKAKTTFLARMSHEIRTPITTVSGILELIRQDCIRDGIHRETLLERIDTASTANQYLLTLINDILDIAKIESNELTLSPADGDLRKVVASITAMIKTMAEKKQIHLVLQRKTNISNWYRMDAVRISQILMNLLSNAIKFTPVGGTVTFMGESCLVNETEVMMTFTVSDTGVGIADEFKQDVFEPFKQEYNSSKSGYGGTGIGLAISRSLARLMGGDITFESEKGKGSTFIATMRLPIVKPVEEAVPLVQNTDLRLDGVTVLLCEDNEINQMIAEELLTRQGCTVLTADDGVEAVAAFTDSAPGAIDCVLMDVCMPNMDGLEATQRIRLLHRPDAKRVPIIAMSANAYEEDRQLSLKAGMNDHLSKPVEPGILYQTIRNYVLARS